MDFFLTKRTVYTEKDIERIKEFVEIFIQNLNKIIRVERVESLVSTDLLNPYFREDLLDVLKEKDIDININQDFINMLPIGFDEVFLLYCLHINYRTSKESCRIIAKNFMFTGKVIILETLNKDNFFNINLEEKNKIIHNLVRRSEKGEFPSCPFHYVDNRVKDKFFDTVWDYIDNDYMGNGFFRALFQKFGTQRNQFIQLANQGDESGFIALFHLGLLGKYERGELEI